MSAGAVIRAGQRERKARLGARHLGQLSQAHAAEGLTLLEGGAAAITQVYKRV